jgi:hypothetical protein
MKLTFKLTNRLSHSPKPENPINTYIEPLTQFHEGGRICKLHYSKQYNKSLKLPKKIYTLSSVPFLLLFLRLSDNQQFTLGLFMMKNLKGRIFSVKLECSQFKLKCIGN